MRDHPETAESDDFRSLLSPGMQPLAYRTEAPDCFHDLHLDRVVAALTIGRGDYHLEPVFYTALPSVEHVQYRQQVYADLARAPVREHAAAFTEAMTQHRAELAQHDSLRVPWQRAFWLLSATLTYQHAVRDLADALADDPLHSAGMQGLRHWLRGYVTGAEFTRFVEQGETIRRRLDEVRFTMLLDGAKVTVRPYAGEADCSAAVEATFARFRQGKAADHLVRFPSDRWVDAVEEQVVEIVAAEHSDLFTALAGYVQQYQDSYLHPVIADIDRALQFYLSYRAYTDRFVAAGLSVTMPRLAGGGGSHASGIVDLALADTLLAEDKPVVTNAFQLAWEERIIVVTGANQGGKTTFSRAFGQLHWLASLGLPVPGIDVVVGWFDQLFTHYAREEQITTRHGKLEDELIRIHTILHAATSDSIIIMNEMFNATTVEDAVLLGTAVLGEIIDRDIRAVCVTFLDELSTLSDTIVSMVAAVDPRQPTIRTFKVERRPADGLAYAGAVAEMYGLTKAQLIERLRA